MTAATYLDDLEFTGSLTGWGEVGKGVCGACVADGNANNAIGIYKEDGSVVAYEKGIGLHSHNGNDANNPAYVQVDVPEGMRYFTAVAGVNQCRERNSDVKMQFKATAYDANGAQVGTAFDATLGNNDADTSYKVVNLNLEGASYIRLEILNGGNGNGSDHGVFADAKFTANEVDQTTRLTSAGFNNDGVKGINDYTYAKDPNTANGIYFTNGTNAGDYTIEGGSDGHNNWTGSKKVVQGIANPMLNNSAIEFKYEEPGLFTMDSNNAKDVFTNVKFPFVMDSDGYYTFDSQKMDASFKDGIGKNNETLNWYEGSAEYTHVSQTDKENKTGFFPFNDTAEAPTDADGTRIYDGELNYWFGMNMAINFYMMNGGYTDKEKKDPIIFEFAGDDDVWVYIDGKLVMDLGGIHDMVSGTINFGTREVIIENEAQSTQAISLDDLLDKSWGKGSDMQPHSLEVFYLERGKGASNLKMRFNLPQRDELVIEKAFDNTGSTAEDLDELNGHEFWFRLDQDGKPWPNATYVLMEHGTIKTENLATLPDGTFSLKYGQKAVFTLETPRSEEHTYQVEEFLKESQNPPNGAGYWDPNKFTTTWRNAKNDMELDKGKTRLANEIIIPAKETYKRTEVDTYSCVFHNYRNTYLNDDTVVIDYGKKMNVDVFANDEVFTKRNMALSEETNTNGDFSVGSMAETGEQCVMYAPKEYMDEIETTYYTVQDVFGQDQTAKVTVIPATTVYYEDDFPGITFNGGWSAEGDSSTTTDIQDDGTVGAGNNYGYDSTYDGDDLYSAGGAHYIDGRGKDTNASFTFKGTGFDIISRTDNETGRIRVVVKNEAGEQVYAKILDTVYQTEGETLYQIPVIRKTGLAYDTYTVTITVLAAIPNDEGSINTRFYLDAIRVYDPLGKTSDELDDRAEAAYNTDKEANPYIQELRNMMIDQNSFDPNQDFDGVVYIDGSEKVHDIGLYEAKGPNNEVYLKGNYQKADEEGILGGDSIVTTLTTADGNAPDSIQIGAKAPNGTSSFLVSLITDEGFVDSQVVTLDTATDMYYDFKDIFVDEPLDSEWYPWAQPTVDWTTLDWKNGVTIIVMNVSEDPSVVSLTNLKTTGRDVSCKVQPEKVNAILKAMNKVVEAPQTLNINSAVVEKHSSDAKLTVNTTDDITKLKLTENGKNVKLKKVTSKVEEDGTITWTVILNLSGKAKSHAIDIFALDADGNQSEAAQVTVNVKKGGK